MNRSRVFRLIGLCVLGSLMGSSCDTFSFTFTFVTPETKESTETQTIALAAGAAVQVSNDLGSTRITVDPAATQATIEITKTALADTEEEAQALLGRMTVTVTAPTAENNTLVISAVRPADATEDQSQFESTITDDEISIVAIVGSARVAQYRLRITLPPGHPVSASQGSGPVRTLGLDAPSTLSADAGSVHSIAARTNLTVSTGAGSIEIESHQGSLDVATDAGSVDLEVSFLTPDQHIIARVQIGSIDLLLPGEIDANLQALAPEGFISFAADDFDQANVTRDTRVLVEAILGSGGATIDLETDFGSIDIESF